MSKNTNELYFCNAKKSYPLQSASQNTMFYLRDLFFAHKNGQDPGLGILEILIPIFKIIPKL